MTIAIAATAGFWAPAIVNRQLAQKAQRDKPPKRAIYCVAGVRLLYAELEREGRWFCPLHGSMIRDFEFSELIDLASENQNHRLILFDRVLAGCDPECRVDGGGGGRSLREST